MVVADNGEGEERKGEVVVVAVGGEKEAGADCQTIDAIGLGNAAEQCLMGTRKAGIEGAQEEGC